MDLKCTLQVLNADMESSTAELSYLKSYHHYMIQDSKISEEIVRSHCFCFFSKENPKWDVCIKSPCLLDIPSSVVFAIAYIIILSSQDWAAVGGRDTKSTVARVMAAIKKTGVATKLNWFGKGTKGKIAFGSMQLCKVVYSNVHSAFFGGIRTLHVGYWSMTLFFS